MIHLFLLYNLLNNISAISERWAMVVIFIFRDYVLFTSVIYEVIDLFIFSDFNYLLCTSNWIYIECFFLVNSS